MKSSSFGQRGIVRSSTKREDGDSRSKVKAKAVKANVKVKERRMKVKVKERMDGFRHLEAKMRKKVKARCISTIEWLIS